jgi:LacI family transcriptional regulator
MAGRSTTMSYLEVAARLRAELAAGRLGDLGSALQTEPVLARQFGVSRMTLRRSISCLIDEGWLESRRGAGNFVRRLPDGRPARCVALWSPLLGADVDDPWFRHLSHGLLTACAHRRWTLRLALAVSDLDAIAGRPNGPEVLIVAGCGVGDLAQLDGVRLPLRFTDSAAPEGHPVLRPDAAQGLDLAVAHVVQLGHRRLGVVEAATSTGTASLRPAAIRASAARHGLPVPLVHPGSYHRNGAEAALAAFMAMPAAERPTAVFCANDRSAVGALSWCRAKGIEVPRDLSIVGFDGLDLTAATTPTLTTVAQDFQRHGERILDAVEDPSSAEQPTAMQLQVRGSTGVALPSPQ